ncbi:DUF4185 domain-containing protein [Ideonella sp.]|uniref:DUF4185 domain-containing protein n=1 Tax=Ideonella sp. TaxID=1929293 RepID=UPI0035ADB982
MRKQLLAIRVRRLVAACGVACVAGLGATGAAAADIVPWSGVAAPEWTALFDTPYGTADGWAGADGLYPIPLDGVESLGAGARPGARTLWWFSDTFVGGTNADGSRIGGTVMVNNTTALQTGAQPLAGSLAFQVRRDAKGAAQSMVVPKGVDTWYWPQDGVVLDGQVRLFASRMQRGDGSGGAFDFAQVGVDLLSAPATDAVPFLGAYTRKAMPLFAKGDGTRGDIYFGVTAMPNTVAAGAPHPDGWLYVYGVRSDDLNKKLLVARVKPGQVANGSAYRFWNGSEWVADMLQSAPIANRMGAELSVTPLPDGRYLVTHQLDTLGAKVVVRYGNSPVGPFDKAIPVWLSTENQLTPNTFVYGAKAHGPMSAPGELLISYHVNTNDFWENFRAGGSDIYRPRFVRVPLPQ